MYMFRNDIDIPQRQLEDDLLPIIYIWILKQRITCSKFYPAILENSKFRMQFQEENTFRKYTVEFFTVIMVKCCSEDIHLRNKLINNTVVYIKASPKIFLY